MGGGTDGIRIDGVPNRTVGKNRSPMQNEQMRLIDQAGADRDCRPRGREAGEDQESLVDQEIAAFICASVSSKPTCSSVPWRRKLRILSIRPIA